MIAVIAGATGLTGQAIVQQLEPMQEITEIKVLVRTSGIIAPSIKLKEIILPWNGLKNLRADIRTSLSGDFYFCALGTTIKKAGSPEAFREIDFDAIFSFAQIAEAHSAQSLTLISSSGANPNSPIFYSRVKGETESAVSKLKIPRIVILRPGLLIGDRIESRPAERMAIQAWRALASVRPESISHSAGTPISNLAHVAVAEGLKSDPGRLILESGQLQ